jgi:serine/threonine protein kinase
LSLENVLLTNVPGDAFGNSIVQVIDFGEATLERSCVRELRGKPSYQAPEMHKWHAYDSLLVDCFALGVLLYSMATQGYPWASTKPGVCPFFQYVMQKGVHIFLKKRTLQKDTCTTVAKVVSPALRKTIEGLLDVEPSSRLTLGESCFAQTGRCSVWEERWLSNDSYSFPMYPKS